MPQRAGFSGFRGAACRPVYRMSSSLANIMRFARRRPAIRASRPHRCFVWGADLNFSPRETCVLWSLMKVVMRLPHGHWAPPADQPRTIGLESDGSCHPYSCDNHPFSTSTRRQTHNELSHPALQMRCVIGDLFILFIHLDGLEDRSAAASTLKASRPIRCYTFAAPIIS